MKFAFKLTGAIMLLLSITLSIGGAYTISQNHAHALSSAQEQNALLHLKERYFVENALWNAEDNTITGAFVAINEYATQQSAAFGTSKYPMTIFSKSGTTVFSNVPSEVSYNAQFVAMQAENSISYYKAEGKTYMLMSSPIQHVELDLILINAYDTTDFFTERRRQLWQFFTFEVVMLIISGTAAAILSHLLTRPLQKLKKVSQQIAQGDFEVRANIKVSDEVGDLGNSFNLMAIAIESYIKELREENHRKSRFVAAFTHELKTPMTSIIGYADLMRSSEQSQEKRQKSLNYIYHEAKRLEQLSKKLLCLLTVENGQIDLTATPINAVIADVLRSSEDISFDIQVKDNQIVLADRVLLADLLCNLAKNAINAQPIDNTVHISCVEEKGKYILKVSDNGCGISAKEIAKITEPFYTIDKSRSRKTGGTGLGLAICTQIAKVHGSELYIDSTHGLGTSVWIILQKGEGNNE